MTNEVNNRERFQILEIACLHKWQLIAGLVLFTLLKVLWWDNVQFIGRIPPNGQPKIVFVSCRAGTSWGEIYSMNLDGSEKTLLLSYPIDPIRSGDNIDLERPVIRPDRRQIAYYVRQGNKQSIWTMSMNGSWNRRITPWASIAGNPNYTVDGRHILFSYLYPSHPHMPGQFYSMNTKGKRWQYVGRYMNNSTPLGIDKIRDPQGPWIIAEPTGDWFIPVTRYTHILHANGQTFSLPEQAQHGFGFSLNPAHSQFVFCNSLFSHTPQICKMNTDGTGLVRLTSDTLSKRYPRFTPDGTQIVFIHNDDEHAKRASADIYIMNADGTNQRALTQTPENEVWFDVK